MATDKAQRRRATDLDKTQEIETLIQNEEDQRMRTVLLVVQSLNAGIRENTAEQRLAREEFERHQLKVDERMLALASQAEKFSEHIAQGKGARAVIGVAWKAIAGLLMLLQFVILGVVGFYQREIAENTAARHTNEVQHSVFAQKIEQLERRN